LFEECDIIGVVDTELEPGVGIAIQVRFEELVSVSLVSGILSGYSLIKVLLDGCCNTEAASFLQRETWY
jgi:hypothetical protein